MENIHLTGLSIAVSTFLVIGLFHPIVIKMEYYFGVRLWWIFLLAGIAFITAGIVMLSFLSASAVVLANVLGVILGILWMVEGVSALMLLRGRVEQNALATGYAIVALVIGVLLLLTPVWGTAFLRWMIGFGLVLLGIAQVYRAAMASREIKVNVEVKAR